MLEAMLMPGLWAIQPRALESLRQSFEQAALSGMTEAPFQAAEPASPLDGLAFAQRRGRVAVVDVEGVIMRREGSVRVFGQELSWVGHDAIRAAIDAAMRDPEIGAVLLSFHSPGGVAAGVKELRDHIAASRREKPIHAYADGLCASAAYWLASATGSVLAPATAEIGSIGVICTHVDRSLANERFGFRVTHITAGARKAAGNPDSPLTPADREYLQASVDKLHAIFREDVARAMPVDATQPGAWGDGQVFMAGDALDLGLINDIVTDREECISRINKEIGMDREELEKTYPELTASVREEAAALARAEALADAENLTRQGAERATATVLALLETVCGADAAGKVRGLLEAGVTPEQLRAVSGLLSQPAAAAPADDFRRDMLAAVRAATPAPVGVNVGAHEDEAAALISRIGGLQ